MKKHLRFIQVLSLVIAALSSRGILHSYAYNPSTAIWPEGVLAVTPYLYSPSLDPYTLGMDLEGAYGISKQADLTVDFVDLTLAPQFCYNFSWVMFRYDFGENNIGALEVSQYFISPQYHFFQENDLFAFEANILAQFGYTNFNEGAMYGAYIAPVYKLIENTLYVYLEFDPFYTVGSGFTLAVLPGIWVGLGDAGQFSLAATLSDITGTVTPGVALWYTLDFDLVNKKPVKSTY